MICDGDHLLEVEPLAGLVESLLLGADVNSQNLKSLQNVAYSKKKSGMFI